MNNTIRSHGPSPQRVLFQKPQVNLACSSSTRMWMVSVCAGLAILQSSMTDSFASLFVALAAVAGALLTELLIDNIALRRFILHGGSRETGLTGVYRDGSAVASALILTLLLPNQIHPLLAFLGSMFAMAVIKHSFGGLGCNWVNPALGAWLFIRFGWPGAFADALKDSSLALPGTLAPVIFEQEPLDIFWTSLLNKTIFSLTSSELPGGYIDLLVYSGPGIIAERGLLALLLGTIIITACRISRSWIPISYLGVYCLLVRAFGAFPVGGVLGGGDMLFGLLSGGTLVAAFILAADPSTGPKSRIGVLIITILGGVLSFVFRYWGFEPYGAFFAVVLLNALVPLFRYFETRIFYTGTSNEVSRGGVDVQP
ncbi:RnfABCDGE type electron transport complex subunit D [Treponema primitia]|uniref:RnfABCDGE type electron transport complex subunit D n=1 Tax=Treponema primitia TaxID=88058 RepID=UPI001E3171E3|nr:RnfABCDGE type electron transport complex subunit D [Treponema primitia]